jgi:hypothetical protein
MTVPSPDDGTEMDYVAYARALMGEEGGGPYFACKPRSGRIGIARAGYVIA